jgi:hypothetical protein
MNTIFSFQLGKDLSPLSNNNFENVQLQNHQHCKIMVQSWAAGDSPKYSEQMNPQKHYSTLF